MGPKSDHPGCISNSLATTWDRGAETMTDRELDDLCINSIRFLAADALEKAKSGHPGASIGALSGKLG